MFNQSTHKKIPAVSNWPVQPDKNNKSLDTTLSQYNKIQKSTCHSLKIKDKKPVDTHNKNGEHAT
jgi:hypothetical protein